MLKIRNVAIAISLASFVLFASTGCQFESSATGDVSSKVTTQQGRPASSADVTVSTAGTSTSGSGSSSTTTTTTTTVDNSKTYSVYFNNSVVQGCSAISGSNINYVISSCNLTVPTDYTVDGTKITLTQAGYTKSSAYFAMLDN